ncbi:MAG: amidohydrolase family protein [Gemmatimonadota bacterium]
MSCRATSLLPLLLILAGTACDGPPSASRAGASDGATTSRAPGPGPYDWLIRGGTVLDGTGSVARRADVLLVDGRVAWLGTVNPSDVDVRDIVEADGLVVAPGFIDVHAHGDPLDSPAFENFLAMGVTTIVLGQDGSSPPAGELADHLEAVDRSAPAVNVAYLVGHNTVRMESGVGYGTTDAAGRDRMATLVGTAMDAGAFGLSTGLEYDPGIRADMEELAAIAGPVAARNGVVMSHMRNEDADAVHTSLEELLEQGRRSGARVHASHMKVVLGNDPAQAHAMLSAMASARAEGIAATGDVYPYTASFTGVSILFPEWARPPHDYASVAHSRRDELLAHLRDRVESRNGPEATLFGAGPHAGSTLAEVAHAQDRPFEEVLLDLGPGGARAAYFVMNEEVMSTFLADPFVAVASDGSPSMAHPRGYGTFPLVLERWVREERLLSFEEAVRKMTGLPAAILGLDRAPDDATLDDATRLDSLQVDARDDLMRGRLEVGWAADLVLFSLEVVGAPADFEIPHRLARGMRHVFVAGEPVWERGEPVPGPGRGKALRRRR